jgi:hypothetical protein
VKKPVSWSCERSRRGRSLLAVAPRQPRPSRAQPERMSEPRPQMVLILDPRHEPLARYTLISACPALVCLVRASPALTGAERAVSTLLFEPALMHSRLLRFSEPQVGFSRV